MSALFSSLAHKASAQATLPGYILFRRALNNVENTQRRLLHDMLVVAQKTEFGRRHRLEPSLTWEKLRKKIGISEYADWQEYVSRQRDSREAVLCERCDRYQPTSGSTSRMKWIPYSSGFLKQIDQAISPWMHDLYQENPGIRRGRHYWSISWIPTELRAKIKSNVNDDLKILPWWKRSFLSMTMAVPESVSSAPSSEATQFTTLCYLAAQDDLSLMSVWSPTFTLGQMEDLALLKDEVAQVLVKGKWTRRWAGSTTGLVPPLNPRAAGLLKAWDGTLCPGFFQELWPRLALVSCWDTAASAIWAQKLRGLFPGATFQGKGLLATEGVVTIPFANQYPLALRSHFFEFKDLDSGKALPAWKLRKGQVLQPILTTGSGFFRYALRDRIRVTGFIGECPSFEFLGRLDGIDLVGEKLSPELAQNILNQVARTFAVNPLSLLGVAAGDATRKPFYLLLCEGKLDANVSRLISKKVEELLAESFHYKLARDLNQLAAAGALVSPAAREIYDERGLARGMIAGTMKIEPLVAWEMPLSQEIKAQMTSSHDNARRRASAVSPDREGSMRL